VRGARCWDMDGVPLARSDAEEEEEAYILVKVKLFNDRGARVARMVWLDEEELYFPVR